MELGLGGKVALVSGGTRGIGRATVRALAKEGCAVGFCARDEAGLVALVDELHAAGVTCAAVAADVLRPEDAERFVCQCAEQLGGIDILVNNVGFSIGGDLMHATDAEWHASLEANTLSAVRLIRLAVPHMRQRGGGAIVNLGSMSGWAPQMAGTAQYGGSKAMTIYITERLALELAHDNIRVNVVSPGSIEHEGGVWGRYHLAHPDLYAEYLANSFPMGRMGTPEDVADVIVFLCSERARWVNGRHIPVDGLQQPTPTRTSRPW